MKNPEPHGFTWPMDITRPRTTSSRCGYTHFPPPRSTRFQRNQGYPGQFSRTNDEELRPRATREKSFTILAAFGDAFPCAMQSWTRAQKGSVRERNETKRNEAERRQDPTGWCCGPPNALRVCGFRYLGSSGEDKKAKPRKDPTNVERECQIKMVRGNDEARGGRESSGPGGEVNGGPVFVCKREKEDWAAGKGRERGREGVFSIAAVERKREWKRDKEREVEV